MENQRKFRRVPFQCVSSISCGDRTWSGELLDISLRGALLLLPVSALLKPASGCFLDIVLGDGEIHLQFEAELVHRDGDRYGFRFLSENLETLTHLRRLLELNFGEDKSLRSELSSWLER